MGGLYGHIGSSVLSRCESVRTEIRNFLRQAVTDGVKAVVRMLSVDGTTVDVPDATTNRTTRVVSAQAQRIETRMTS